MGILTTIDLGLDKPRQNDEGQAAMPALPEITAGEYP